MRAKIEIISYDKSTTVIRDVGTDSMSVTNDAEAVVKYLQQNTLLAPAARLYYYDSENQLDEILFDENGFKGFNVLKTDAGNEGRLLCGSDPAHHSLFVDG